jgi:ribosomal protein L11 methylase PrmA
MSRLQSSFRDPSGFLFRDPDGTLLRQVNREYGEDYRRLMESGLYDELVAEKLLIEHEEVDRSRKLTDDADRVIRPRELPFISYPYEWPFSALKDAALLTLEIQRRALNRGMVLKDASAFNVQFEGTRPIFIDTLSFEKYRPGTPWVAYAQFCRHFLAPLALMAKVDADLGRSLAIHLDGFPLGLAARALPVRTLLSPGLLMHLHLHAWLIRSQMRRKGRPEASPLPARKVSPSGLKALMDSLGRSIDKLRLRISRSEWSDYYDTHSYSKESFERKKELVERFIRRAAPGSVWDLGANTGLFSRLARSCGARTVAVDSDPLCVEKNYRAFKESDPDILSLRIDLTNPSPGLGWANEERAPFLERGPADCILALALIHHLAIANNTPLDSIASLLVRSSNRLIIEWVPKEDVQVQSLLRSRRDIFVNYRQEGFEAAFLRHFKILEREPIGASGRVLYLFEK